MATKEEKLKKDLDIANDQLKTIAKQLKGKSDELEKAVKEIAIMEKQLGDFLKLQTKVEELEADNKKLEKATGKLTGEFPKLPLNGVELILTCEKLCEASPNKDERVAAYALTTKNNGKVLMSVGYVDGKCKSIIFQPMSK